MHALPYRFANILWVDYLVQGSSLGRAVFRLALFSISPWLIGLVIASHADRTLAYLTTPAFYLGTIGILLTTSTIAYGSNKQYSMYERFLECFDLSENARLDVIREALARHSNLRLHLRAAAIIFCICAFFVATGFFWWSELEPFSRVIGTTLPRFEAFSQYGWYDESIAGHGALCVLVFSVFISLPLGTSGSIIIRLPLFLWRTSAYKPLLPPALIKMHFSLITSFYARVSFLWLMGVVLTVYFFGINKDWLSYGIVGMLFLFGLVNFAIPQIAYARVVDASEDLFIELLSKRILNSIPDRGAIMGDEERSDRVLHSLSGMDPLIGLLTQEHWVYPLHQTYIIIGAYVLSLVSWSHLISELGI